MFDASTRQVCKVKSSNTNTSLHALTTLNDPTWNEAARVLAAKTITSAATTPDRMTFAYRRLLSREPKPDERAILAKMLDQQLARFRAEPAAAKKFLTVGAAPQETKLDPVEHAAWASLMLAVFNLDEALTRE